MLKVWAQDEKKNLIFNGTKEYGFDFISAKGFVPATPWAAAGRVNENVLEPEKTREEVFVFGLPKEAKEIEVKATLTYVYIQDPPAEAKVKMQQMMGQKVMSAPPQERERVSEAVQKEVAIRMKAMGVLATYFPDLKMAEAGATLSLK